MINQLKKLTKSSLIAAVILFSTSITFAQNQKDSVHIDLKKAIEIGLSESPSMRIADRDIQIKQQYKKEQIVSLFPDVSLSGSYQYTILKQSMAMSGEVRASSSTHPVVTDVFLRTLP